MQMVIIVIILWKTKAAEPYLAENLIILAKFQKKVEHLKAAAPGGHF